MSTNDENQRPDDPEADTSTPSPESAAGGEGAPLAPTSTAPLRTGLRYGLIGLGALLVLGLLVWWPYKGTPGLWGVLVGAGIGGGFILITVATILATSKASPSVVMGALMGSYVVKVVIVLAVVAVIRDMDFYDKGALVSMLVGTIVAVLGSEIWGVLSTRTLYVDPDVTETSPK
ncbi:hypothetical protein [Gordonia shandongensis]|uniref:hypothetical protein n=1 Tax=Gordonia shandongensis TaxID=376351 RepID=UPI0003F623DE|nr:hypothetical protein [Gordonia shandongensis]